MITAIPCLLFAGAVLGGGMSFDAFEKDRRGSGIACAIFAFVALGGVIALELLVKG